MTVQVVERWCHFSKRRIDLFGVIDLVAMDGASIIGYQTTSGSNVSARLAKIKAEPRAMLWLQGGGRLVIHGWRKLASTGKWECREIEVTADMFEQTEHRSERHE